MGGIIKAVKRAFNPPSAPAPVIQKVAAPTVQPVRDTARENDAKKKSISRAKRRGGRASTILSSERGGKLGAA